MDFFQNLAWACWWDVPVLLFLIVATAWFLVTKRKLKREKEELKNQMTK